MSIFLISRQNGAVTSCVKEFSPLLCVRPLFFWEHGLQGLFPRRSIHPVFLFLRRYTNGYHAHTECGCVAVSVLCEICAMWVLPCFCMEMYVTVLIASIVFILLLAPVNNGAIHLFVEEMRAMRWRSWLGALVEVILSLFLCWQGKFSWAVSIAFSLFTMSGSLAFASMGFGI